MPVRERGCEDVCARTSSETKRWSGWTGGRGDADGKEEPDERKRRRRRRSQIGLVLSPSRISVLAF